MRTLVEFRYLARKLFIGMNYNNLPKTNNGITYFIKTLIIYVKNSLFYNSNSTDHKHNQIKKLKQSND